MLVYTTKVKSAHWLADSGWLVGAIHLLAAESAESGGYLMSGKAAW